MTGGADREDPLDVLMASVPPFAARWLLRQVPRETWVAGVQWAQQQQRPDYARQLQVARRQLLAADQQSGLPSVGSAEVVAMEAAAGSVVMEEMTPQQAADVLGCSPRRVLQLVASGAVTGRRDGRRWLLERSSVMDLRDARSGA